MIKAENLTKVYRTEEIETTALNSIDFQIESGDFVGIMGPSGCGKSTLLNIMGLLDTPTSGNYYFLEENMAGYSERDRARFRKGNIGFIFQSFNLIEELTVFENVELPLQYLNVPSAERKVRVEEALDRMKMMARRNHFPQQLSGGQQQRVAISRAVVTGAKLLLADEPTGNLDSDHGDEVMSLLTEQNRAGTTIVMVTHSPHDAKYAKKIINLFDGNIVKDKEPEGFGI